MQTIDALREPLDDLRRRDRDCNRRSDTKRRADVNVEPAVDAVTASGGNRPFSAIALTSAVPVVTKLRVIVMKRP